MTKMFVRLWQALQNLEIVLPSQIFGCKYLNPKQFFASSPLYSRLISLPISCTSETMILMTDWLLVRPIASHAVNDKVKSIIADMGTQPRGIKLRESDVTSK